MLTALVRLRSALQEVRLPLELPSAAAQPRRPARDGRPARGLRHPAPDDDRRPAARPSSAARPAPASRRWSTRWSARRVTQPGVLRPTTRSPVLVHNPADAEWFGQDRLLPELERVTRVDQRPRRAAARAVGRRAGRARHPRRARHRLGRGAQPHPRRPAARGRRPVALRHLRRPLRRPGAVGLPAQGRRALRRRRDRARPHAAGRRRDRLDPPGPDAREPRAQGLTALHRHRGRASARRACCRPSRSPRSAAGSSRWPPTPRRAPPWCGRPSTAPSAPWPGAPTRSPTPRPSRSTPYAACATTPTRPTTRRWPRSPRPPPTARCCAARCSPAGRSSSAPASCSSRWRRGSAGCATGSSTRSRASPSRPSG